MRGSTAETVCLAGSEVNTSVPGCCENVLQPNMCKQGVTDRLSWSHAAGLLCMGTSLRRAFAPVWLVAKLSVSHPPYAACVLQGTLPPAVVPKTRHSRFTSMASRGVDQPMHLDADLERPTVDLLKLPQDPLKPSGPWAHMAAIEPPVQPLSYRPVESLAAQSNKVSACTVALQPQVSPCTYTQCGSHHNVAAITGAVTRCDLMLFCKCRGFT